MGEDGGMGEDGNATHSDRLKKKNRRSSVGSSTRKILGLQISPSAYRAVWMRCLRESDQSFVDQH